MAKESKTKNSPPDGISFILPTGEYVTARIGNSPEANRAIYTTFWTAWGRYYRNRRSVQVDGNRPHQKK